MIELLLGFITNLYERFLELLLAPINYPDTLWMVIPVLITLFLVEIYFGRYKTEDLGWESAFENSLVLLFVSLDMIRLLYNQYGLSTFIYINPKIALIIAVVIEGIVLSLMSFYHELPKDITFKLSSALPMNFIAYISLLLVYTDIPIVSIYTLLSAFGILAVLVGMIKLVRLAVPATYES